MSTNEETPTGHDEDLTAFEKELQAVLALDPIERLQRYESMHQKMAEDIRQSRIDSDN